jgi:hypothetical protein
MVGRCVERVVERRCTGRAAEQRGAAGSRHENSSSRYRAAPLKRPPTRRSSARITSRRNGHEQIAASWSAPDIVVFRA